MCGAGARGWQEGAEICFKQAAAAPCKHCGCMGEVHAAGQGAGRKMAPKDCSLHPRHMLGRVSHPRPRAPRCGSAHATTRTAAAAEGLAAQRMLLPGVATGATRAMPLGTPVRWRAGCMCMVVDVARMATAANCCCCCRWVSRAACLGLCACTRPIGCRAALQGTSVRRLWFAINCTWAKTSRGALERSCGEDASCPNFPHRHIR